MGITFASLGLAPEVLKAVVEQGYETPTAIQAEAIPVILEGKDVLGAAQTGTGKTAAFTLPILTRIIRHANHSASPARHPIRALILTPTRELADQVYANVATYSKGSGLRSHVVYGGVDIKAQIPALREGIEVLVATPGRLLDHIQQKSINLSQVEILVLDEADRMLDMGFILDIQNIFNLCTNRKQTLLFSATFAPEILKLSKQFMHEPVKIEVARKNSANESVKQELHPVETARKRALLAHLIRVHQMTQVIVFCRTKIGTDQVARDLKRAGFSCEAIHGDRDQRSRTEALTKFKAGEIQVLVATDVAARGLDVTDLPFVVNYELPTTPEDYVHRIGRTGRAGATGVAISLVAPEEGKSYEGIKKLLNREMPLIPVHGFSPGTIQVIDERERPPRAERRHHTDPTTDKGVKEYKQLERMPSRAQREASEVPAFPSNLPKLPKRPPQIAALFQPPQRNKS
ncbi:DEAD/DEAH box helicase [Deefgea tanakiae]|jgi:ATP-dependent RNA helicase RhlE|uniref:DEAD/DEAH box helicase n=1 Tax=Deefgea tanakiae TaxID=2865840 RepID=UPI0027E408AA|nr:DEAD/DEAH box helicase [Deefgea tanakiae]